MTEPPGADNPKGVIEPPAAGGGGSVTEPPGAGLKRLVPGARQSIESYGVGRFRVSGESFAGPIVILPDRTLVWPGAPCSDEALNWLLDTVAPSPGEPPEAALVVLGGGDCARPPSPEMRSRFRARGVSLEAMATAAACRTFAMLAAENRSVAAALAPMAAPAR